MEYHKSRSREMREEREEGSIVVRSNGLRQGFQICYDFMINTELLNLERHFAEREVKTKKTKTKLRGL
jgi:predicted amidohydrolase